MFTLPVSGAAIALREPDGVDEMLLHEAAGSPVEAGLALLARIGGAALDAPGLVVTDFEYLLLQLRASRFGQAMTLGFACPHCRELAEVSFRIADYLADARPRAVPSVVSRPTPPNRDGLAWKGRVFGCRPPATRWRWRDRRIRRGALPRYASMKPPANRRTARGWNAQWKPCRPPCRAKLRGFAPHAAPS